MDQSVIASIIALVIMSLIITAVFAIIKVIKSKLAPAVATDKEITLEDLIEQEQEAAAAVVFIVKNKKGEIVTEHKVTNDSLEVKKAQLALMTLYSKKKKFTIEKTFTNKIQ